MLYGADAPYSRNNDILASGHATMNVQTEA